METRVGILNLAGVSDVRNNVCPELRKRREASLYALAIQPARSAEESEKINELGKEYCILVSKLSH